jgi:hypothetical protein
MYYCVSSHLAVTGITASTKGDGNLDNMNQDRLPEIEIGRVACQQILEKDNSIFSIQWVILPLGIDYELTSGRVLQLYLDYIMHFTLGIIRSVESDNGLEFRLAGSSIAIISFAPPRLENTAEGEKTTLRISGGLLVQPKECDMGQLEFLVEAVESGCRVTLKLSGFRPLLLGSRQPSLWRKWLYRLTQASLHKTVTIRFLAMVYRKITGERLKKGVVRIALRKGEET